MPKWVYPLAFVFLIFLIYTDPTGAGQIANAFVEFLSTLLSALGEFLSGLFGDVDNASRTSTGNEVTVYPRRGSVSPPTTLDYFQHGHTHQYGG